MLVAKSGTGAPRPPLAVADEAALALIEVTAAMLRNKLAYRRYVTATGQTVEPYALGAGLDKWSAV